MNRFVDRVPEVQRLARSGPEASQIPSGKSLARDALGVCYVTDDAFLFPTLMSVTSLRRFLPVGAARVFVVLLDASVDLRPVREATRHLGIDFISVTPHSLPALSGFDWSATHVTPAAIGRFLLSELLPSEIDRILYLDGDTRVVGSLTPLLSLPMPEKSLAAVDDAVDLYRRDNSANGLATRSYFDGIGLGRDRTYFNSGVLLVGRQTWADISSKALAFLSAYPDRCIYHDQSALNATVGADRIHLSPIWNFQSRFRSWGASGGLEPRILHFTGAGKPWLGALAPWRDMTAPLAADASTLRPLSMSQRPMTPVEVDAHNAEFGGFKERLRMLIDVRRRLRAHAIVRLHQRAAI